MSDTATFAPLEPTLAVIESTLLEGFTPAEGPMTSCHDRQPAGESNVKSIDNPGLSFILICSRTFPDMVTLNISITVLLLGVPLRPGRSKGNFLLLPAAFGRVKALSVFGTAVNRANSAIDRCLFFLWAERASPAARHSSRCMCCPGVTPSPGQTSHVQCGCRARGDGSEMRL